MAMWTLMIIQQFSRVNSVFFFTARIFAAANVEDTSICAILSGIVNVFVGIAFMFLVVPAERNLLVLLSSLGCAVAPAGTSHFSSLEISSKIGNIQIILNLFPL